MNVTTITMTATTLVIGRSRGRNSSLKNQIGNVRSCPAVNSVTMISSNDSANASMPPASSAVALCGSTMCRKVCQPSAPRSIDASIQLCGMRRRRATTLL